MDMGCKLGCSNHAAVTFDGIEESVIHVRRTGSIKQDIEDHRFGFERRQAVEEGRMKASVPWSEPVRILVEAGMGIVIHVEDDGAFRADVFAKQKRDFVAQLAQTLSPRQRE